jgi:hypothetical protein
MTVLLSAVRGHFGVNLSVCNFIQAGTLGACLNSADSGEKAMVDTF